MAHIKNFDLLFKYDCTIELKNLNSWRKYKISFCSMARLSINYGKLLKNDQFLLFGCNTLM